MSEHTPGPWCVSDGNLLRVTNINKKHPVVVCGVHRNGKYGGKVCGDPLANARLIAAAPDLLEALQNAVNHLEGGSARWRAQDAIRLATEGRP